MRNLSTPATKFHPDATVSTHSVSSLNVTQGTESQKASFCTPPESVSIAFALLSSLSISIYETGLVSIILEQVTSKLVSASFFRVRGCRGRTTGVPDRDNSNKVSIR